MLGLKECREDVIRSEEVRSEAEPRRLSRPLFACAQAALEDVGVRVSDDLDRGGVDMSATQRRGGREPDAVDACVSVRVCVISLDLLEDCADRELDVCACRDGSFLLLYRLMLTEGSDRTPMSSESERPPSTERNERWGRMRRKDVRRFVSR